MNYTITRRLDRTLDELTQEFDALYCDRDYQRVLRDMKRSEGGYWDQNAGILLTMLKQAGLPCERGARNDTTYYEMVIESLIAQGRIPTKDALGDKLMSICESLANKYSEYPTPERYMERLVNRLSNPEDTWQNDPLRLRILKQFIKYGNYASPMLSKGAAKKRIKEYVAAKLGRKNVVEQDILDGIDDAVFTHIKDCDLLDMCEALASGRFRSNGGAKRDLYLFAFVYNMTYFSYTQERAVFDEQRDIGKNLFQDYYATNLMQYISQTYRNGKTESVLDPSDCAINYKNFAEVICLYYLCQETSAKEKIKRASKLIDELKITDSNAEAPNTPDRQVGGTIQMRNYIHGIENADYSIDAEDIMVLSEEDFKAFILANFDRRTDGSRSPFMVNTYGHTAAEVFDHIAEKLQADNLDLSYGLFFDAVRKRAENRGNTDDFQMILEWVDEELRKWLSNGSAGKSISRTRLLAAYYYKFNAEYERDDVSSDEEELTRMGRSFLEHYESFRSGADELFAKVNFAPFSNKNLLDIIIVISSYIYINA